MASYETPLAQVRGKGSAKHGAGHFVAQRVSAIALIGLVIWGVYSALTVAGADFSAARTWLRAPVNAGLTGLLIAVGAYHMQLGMRTIIEDYFARPITASALLILNLFACWIVAIVGVASVLVVAFGGGVS
jgi:succinate dehydrogenase / fumarate reductase membrane anchor subunit